MHESKWNLKTKTGTYKRPIHHNEIVNDSRIAESISTGLEMKQNLAAPEGMELAKKLLKSYVLKQPK